MEKRKLPCWIWFGVASAFSAAVLAVGIVLAILHPHDSWVMVGAGCVCMVAVAVTWPLCASVRDNRLESSEKFLHPLTDRLDQLAILLNLMSEQQLLSDRAISIAYREKDRDALRRAVHEEMGRHDWDAALSLVDEMERAFSNKAETQRLRKEIADTRQDLVRKQINEVVQLIDKHTRAEQWNAAIREADKLIQLFPDSEQVRNLPHEIDSRRLAHKKQLVQNWHEAVARHDNDGSIEILKLLDPYLTPAEAETMQETVRSVFKEKLNNLGAQFATAVKEQRWAEAIRVGEMITKEFPNVRIAQEVRESMETLKKRASEPAAVGV
jgi:outer membrane protein assembly factor BamD (BamD/ComL family)